MSRYLWLIGLALAVIGLVAGLSPKATSCDLINAFAATGTLADGDFVTIGSANQNVELTICSNTFSTNWASTRKTTCAALIGTGPTTVWGDNLSGTYLVDDVGPGDDLRDCVKLCECH